MSDFRKTLRALETAYEEALSDKADALIREGTIQAQNDQLQAMLELCIEAMSIKVSLHPSGHFTIETAAYQRMKGTKEEAAHLLATLAQEQNSA